MTKINGYCTTLKGLIVFNIKASQMISSRLLTIFVMCSIIFSSQYCSSSDSAEKQAAEEKKMSPEEKALSQGKRLFKIHCVSCHGINGKMGFNGAKDLTESQLSLDERKVLIAYGKESMMAFKSILSAEEIEKVAKYSMTFSQA